MFKRIPWKTDWPVKIPHSDRNSVTYIGLGLNIGTRGERLRLLSIALNIINQLPATRVVAVSSIYETPPWGVTDQEAFYNAVVAIKTALPLNGLLKMLKHTEVNMGRQNRQRWGPREIDLDILLSGKYCVEIPGLNVPHKYLIHRRFVLEPLSELNPFATLPHGPRLKSFLTTNL